MIIVGNAVLSDDVKENFFVCNLKKCKGACCVEGDAGAPLEEEELAILDEAAGAQGVRCRPGPVVWAPAH